MSFSKSEIALAADLIPINNTHEKNCVKNVLNFTDSELSSQFCAGAKPQVILIITQSRKKLRHPGCALHLKRKDLIGYL